MKQFVVFLLGSFFSISCLATDEPILVHLGIPKSEPVSQQEDLRMQHILIEQGLEIANLEMKKKKIDAISLYHGAYSTQTLYIRALAGDKNMQKRFSHMKQEYREILVKLAYGDAVPSPDWGTRLEEMPPVVKNFWIRQIVKFYNEGIVESID